MELVRRETLDRLHRLIAHHLLIITTKRSRRRAHRRFRRFTLRPLRSRCLAVPVPVPVPVCVSVCPVFNDSVRV